jgi:hypothetical protein
MSRAERFVSRMEKCAKAYSRWVSKDISTQLAAPNEQVCFLSVFLHTPMVGCAWGKGGMHTVSVSVWQLYHLSL